jgi:hypothetical protein
MATTPNYSWPTPNDTDLVRNGAEAIRDLGDAIDATVFGIPLGGLEEIASGTLSGAQFDITAIPQTYKFLQLKITDAVGSGANQILVRINNDSGANYSQVGFFGTSSAVNNANTATNAGAVCTMASSSPSEAHGTVFFYNYQTTRPTVFMQGTGAGASGACRLATAAYRGTAALTTINLVATAGTITSGDWKLFGGS